MAYEFFVGLRHLKSRKRSFISTITLFCMAGVILGVAVLTSAISVTSGFQETFRDKVLGINSHILVMKYGLNYREYRDTMKDVASVDGVEAVSPFIFHEMLVHHEDRSSWVIIKGLDANRIGEISDLPDYVRAGTLEDLRWTPALEAPSDKAALDDKNAKTSLPGAFLGTELAEKLKVEVGDTIELVSPLRGTGSGSWAPTQMAPTKSAFRVAGFYRSGFNEYDKKLVMVDYRSLQSFFQNGDVVTGVEVRVNDVFQTKRISKDIKKLLPPGRFRTLDWEEINRNLFSSLQLQKIVIALILTFIVIVASFNIVSTLIMLVLDKGKEIAILKSMGASNGGIMRIFIIEGMVIGGLGTSIGLLVGFVTCVIISSSNIGMDPGVYLIDKLPVKMSLLEFAGVAAASLVISFTATLYPSWKAANQPPVEGLRYD